MATLADLVVKIRSDLSGFQTGAAQTQLSGLDAKLKRAGMGARRFGDKMTGAGMRMSAFVTAPLIGLGVAATNAASDLNESTNAVETVFGRASRKIKEFGKTSAQSIGLSTTAFQEMVTPLGAMLQNFGLGADKAAEESINLAERASDMASVFNTDVSEAMVAIQAAFRGEGDPIERFGVNMKASAVEAEALAMGVNKSWNEMTEQEKTAARLSLFMKQTDRIAGDFADTSGEVANAERIAAAEAENQAAIFGQKLIPVKARLIKMGSKLLEMFNNLSPGMKNVILVVAGIAAAMGPAMLALGGLVKGIGSLLIVMGFVVAHPIIALVAALVAAGVAIAAISGRFDGLGERLKSVGEDVVAFAREHWPGFRDAMLDTFNAVADWIDRNWPPVQDAITGVLGAVASWVKSNWPGFRDAVMGVLSAVADWVSANWPGFRDTIIDAFNAIREMVERNWPAIQEVITNVMTIIGAAVTVVVGIIRVAIGIATEIWERFGNHILSLAMSVWGEIQAQIALAMGLIRGVIQIVSALIRGDWGAAWDGVKLILSTVWDFIQAKITLALTTIRNLIGMAMQFVMLTIRTSWEFIKFLIGSTIDIIVGRVEAGWNLLRDVSVSVFNGVKNFITDLWETVKNNVVGKVRSLRDTVKGVWEALRDTTKNIFNSLKDSVSNIWGGIVNAVRGPVNSVIRVVNKLIGGVNTILDKVGLDVRIPTIGTIRGNSGSGARDTFQAREMAAGGMVPQSVGGGFRTRGPTAIVGEGRPAYPEFVVPTDPGHRGRAMALYQQLGSQLMPQMAIGGILGDAFDKGKDFVGGAVESAGGFLGSVFRGGLTMLFSPINSAVKSALAALPNPLHMRDVAQNIREAMWDWVKGGDAGLPDVEAMAAAGGGGGPPGSGVQRWAGVAANALRYTGQSVAWLGDLLRQMQHESGGNPAAINLWDSNARKGTPSQGLMQTIPSTFAAHARELAGRGILNPFANIVAAIRYTVSRYGDLGAWRRRGFAGYQSGGFVQPPGGLAHPGELVLTQADQSRLFGLIRSGKGVGSDGVTLNVEAGAIVVHGSGMSESDAERLGQGIGRGLIDTVISERHVLTQARVS